MLLVSFDLKLTGEGPTAKAPFDSIFRKYEKKNAFYCSFKNRIKETQGMAEFKVQNFKGWNPQIVANLDLLKLI